MIFGKFLDVRRMNAERDFLFDRIKAMNPCLHSERNCSAYIDEHFTVVVCCFLLFTDICDKLSGHLCMFSVIQFGFFYLVFIKGFIARLIPAVPPKNISLKDIGGLIYGVSLSHSSIHYVAPMGARQACRTRNYDMTEFDSAACSLPFISISYFIFY